MLDSYLFIIDPTNVYDMKGDTWDQSSWHLKLGSCFRWGSIMWRCLSLQEKTKCWVVLNSALKSSKRRVKVWCAMKDESGLSKNCFAQRLYRWYDIYDCLYDCQVQELVYGVWNMVERSIMVQNLAWKIWSNFRRVSNFRWWAKHQGAKWFKKYNFIANEEISIVKRKGATRHPSLAHRAHV